METLCFRVDHLENFAFPCGKSLHKCFELCWVGWVRNENVACVRQFPLSYRIRPNFDWKDSVRNAFPWDEITCFLIMPEVLKRFTSNISMVHSHPKRDVHRFNGLSPYVGLMALALLRCLEYPRSQWFKQEAAFSLQR